ncbi:arrestin domain-containing protein 17-like [Patiria miniata]|uniref:Arrestin C-terminal-like domain-containing protein n=1 Tax=Patiria miniata TaxID=46514 RepID=A0A913YXP9_PATMI|nr:arrestin domain-containing protein 17-like [Patiria miniata]
MGKLPLPVIVFDKQGVFSQGDFVSGKVKLKLDNEGLQNIKGVWVLITCKAKAEFGTGTATDDHEQEDVHINSILTVFGAGKRAPAKPDLSLPPGNHSFPFKFRLPTDKVLPSPFEGAYGHVRYRAKATLSIERMIFNKESHTERAFTVRGPRVDLNRLPKLNLKVPVSRCCEVRNLFGLGTKKGATVDFGLTKRGFIPGENIIVTGCVDNISGEEQRVIKVALVQETTYTVEEFLVNATEEHKKILCRSSRNISCPKGKVAKFSMNSLRIPIGCPSSGLPGCKLIDVQYYVECNTSGCIETSFRLTVGTVPIRSVSGPVPSVPTAEEATACTQPSAAHPMDKAKMAAPAPACQARPLRNGSVSRVDDAPPSYEQAIASGTTKENFEGL